MIELGIVVDTSRPNSIIKANLRNLFAIIELRTRLEALLSTACRFKSCRPDYLSFEALRPLVRRAFSFRGQDLRRRASSSKR